MGFRLDNVLPESDLAKTRGDLKVSAKSRSIVRNDGMSCQRSLISGIMTIQQRKCI